jgi:hypothetical protein
VTYCHHCGIPINQQSPEYHVSAIAEKSARFQPSPFATQPLVNQFSVQQTISTVLRCVDCRLLNYSGEEVCKRCGGQLVDRNVMISQSLPSNMSSARSAPHTLNGADESEELQKANKSIKNAWVTGVISGSLTLIASMILAPLALEMLNVPAMLITAAIVFGLSYGVYRKSRTCAVILLSFYALDKIVFYIDSGRMAGIVVTLIFIYYFAKGIEGTFTYHRLMRGQSVQQDYRLSPGHDGIY